MEKRIFDLDELNLGSFFTKIDEQLINARKEIGLVYMNNKDPDPNLLDRLSKLKTKKDSIQGALTDLIISNFLEPNIFVNIFTKKDLPNYKMGYYVDLKNRKVFQYTYDGFNPVENMSKIDFKFLNPEGKNVLTFIEGLTVPIDIIFDSQDKDINKEVQDWEEIDDDQPPF